MSEQTADTLVVAIRFYGIIRDVVGESSVEMRLPRDSTVGDLLRSLTDKYGEWFRQRVMDGPDRFSKFVEIIVNGRQVDRSALDAPLAGGDGRQPAVVNVLVLPPPAGG